MAESGVNVEKLKAGDQDQLAALIVALEPQLQRWVRNSAAYANPSDVDDIVQEAIIKIYRNIDKYGGPDDQPHFLRWCHMVVRNIAIDHLRRCRLRERRIELWDSPAEKLSSHIESEEIQQEIRDALQSLSVDERMIIELRFFLQMTMQEIAEQLEIPFTTVYARTHRAMRKLRLALNEEGLPEK